MKPFAHLVVSFALCSCVAAAQDSALNQGVEFIRDGKFDQALPKLEEAHRLAPGDPMIENLLGIVDTRLGRIESADSHYRAAIALDRAQAAPHRNLGVNLLTEKSFDVAARELHEASRLDPKDPFAHYYLLLLAIAVKKDDDAVREAALAGSLVENDPEALGGLVEAEIRTGRTDQAEALISRLGPDGKLSPQREFQIATLFAQHSAFVQAVSCFRNLAASDHRWQNRFNLAVALLYAKQPEEAASLLATLHSELPGNADVSTFLGEADEMLEKAPEALEAYRDAVAADPSSPDRMLDYTRLLMDSDHYDEAVQAIQSGIGRTASPVPLQVRLGAIEMIKGNYQEARAAFHAALAADPDLDVAYVGLAQTYARETNDSEALQVLESARANHPGHYLLEYYSGMLHSRLGHDKEAEIALDRAAKLQPNSPDPYFELGKLYESRESWQKAKEAFERAIELNPNFVPAHYQLSRVDSHLGLGSQAAQQAELTRTLMNQQRAAALRGQRERDDTFKSAGTDLLAP